jgi:hypothetical protein
LVLDDQLQHDVVEVGTMISTIALGDVHDLLRWGLVTVIAPIDMNACAVEVPIRLDSGPDAWRQSPR